MILVRKVSLMPGLAVVPWPARLMLTSFPLQSMLRVMESTMPLLMRLQAEVKLDMVGRVLAPW